MSTELLRYARQVAERFPGDIDQIEWHLESEFPDASAREIDEALEEVLPE